MSCSIILAFQPNTPPSSFHPFILSVSPLVSCHPLLSFAALILQLVTNLLPSSNKSSSFFLILSSVIFFSSILFLDYYSFVTYPLPTLSVFNFSFFPLFCHDYLFYCFCVHPTTPFKSFVLFFFSSLLFLNSFQLIIIVPTHNKSQTETKSYLFT